MVLSKEKGEVLLLGQDPHTSGQAGNQVVQTTKKQPDRSYNNYLKDGYKDLLVVGSIRRSNGHSLQVRMFTLDMSKKFFTVGHTALDQATQRSCGLHARWFSGFGKTKPQPS